MTEAELLEEIKTAYQTILGSKLTGIYVHGSIAFGCFRWDTSDIDFLAVVHAPLTQPEKEALISKLLALDPFAPPKGFEMSVVTESVCAPFRYPTPFELHYSNTHKQRCRDNLAEYCRTMNGTDPDLAAHFTVLRKAGIVLWGKPIADVFAEVPKADYLDSILGDVRDAGTEISGDPVYYILNLCRVLAYLKDGQVLSKAQGGAWGVQNLDGTYTALIRSALNTYQGKAPFHAEEAALRRFTADLLDQIQEAKIRNCHYE